MKQYTTTMRGKNTRGTGYAIRRNNANNTFSVWIQCHNYELGRIRESWRVVVQNVDEAAATKVYERRLKGKCR